MYRNEMAVNWEVVNSFKKYMAMPFLYGYYGLKHLREFVLQRIRGSFPARAEGMKSSPVALPLDYTLSSCWAWFQR